MATVSDFGSLEIKQLRVQNDISAVRYGTEIMDKDLVFKVGDVSNPNQSIRFSVHDGESYKDAFSVDSNGFAVSDLAMSGPSSGVIGIDELVKLGEMRVQHFNDHNNERAGEIVFSVNIGDTDVRTVDILSLSPEEVEMTTAARIHGGLSCGNLTTGTINIGGNEFRSVIASFHHPLGSNTIRIEKDESGAVMLNGPLKSEESYVSSLTNDVLNGKRIFATSCSVSSLNLKQWTISEEVDLLSIRGHGKVQTNELVTSYSESEMLRSDQVECSSLSVSSLHSRDCITAMVSTSRLYFDSVEWGAHVDFQDVSSMTLGGSMVIEEDKITGSRFKLSGDDLVCGGLRCKDGTMSASGVGCDELSSNVILTKEISADHIVCDGVSVSTTTSGVVASGKMKCNTMSVGDLVGEGAFGYSNGPSFLRLDESGVETRVLYSEEVSCSLMVSKESMVSKLSCSECLSRSLDSEHATVGRLVCEEFYGDACSVGIIDAHELHLEGLRLNREDGYVHISSGLITPSISTHSIHLNTIDTKHDASLSITSEGIVVDSHFLCSGTMQGADARYGSLSCSTIDCDNLRLTNHEFSTDAFTIHGGECSLAFDGAGLELNGSSPLMKLASGASELTLKNGILTSSEVFQVSCSKVLLSDTEVGILSANSLITSNITSPEGDVVVDSALVCHSLSVSELFVLNSTISRELSTGRMYTKDVEFDMAWGVHQISGLHGCEIGFHDSDISIRADSLMMSSERDISFNMQSSQLSIKGDNDCIVMSSSSDVIIESNVSVSGLSSKVVHVESISSAEELKIVSNLKVDQSCIVERELISERMSCSHVNTNTIQDITIVQSKDVHFTEDRVEDYMVVSSECVAIGSHEGENVARLDVHAHPLRDGIRVTSDDMSTIKLQTKRNQRKGMILRNESNLEEWMVGVGNYPLERENTLGLYFNDDPYLQMSPDEGRIIFNKSTVAPALSVNALHLHHELSLRECSFTVHGSDQMVLSCGSLVIPGALSLSDDSLLIMSPASCLFDLDMSHNKISNVASPTGNGDVVNKGYVDTRLGDLFTEERIFTAPVYWAPPTNQNLRSFAIGLAYTNPSNASNTEVSAEILVGTSQNHSLRFVSDLPAGANTLVEMFASHVKVYCPIELDALITLPNTTISSLADALTIGGNVRTDGLGVGVVPVFPLHVVSSSDDDCAVMQSSSSRARTTVESYGEDADQAMFSCKVDSTVFSTGYSKSSDAFIISSSNDLAQNTHLVISRETNTIQSAGDVKVVKSNGNFSIEELGATVFLADKDTLKCENFDISFENFSVDHKLGNLSLLNLSSFGARITGSTSVSESLIVKNTRFLENEIGDMTIDRKMVIPDVETNTVSIDNRQGFNLYQDDTDVLRFRTDGSGMLLDFDSISESLDFSFPTIPNTRGRGTFFVSDNPILSLRKQCINIDTTAQRAKLNVSSENGPQLAILNPSNTPMHTDFTVDDSGELYVNSSQRKYNFDGDLHSENNIVDNFMYFGPNKRWRLGVSDDGSFLIQNNSTGVYVTKTEILLQ